jgi:hypothetical protein
LAADTGTLNIDLRICILRDRPDGARKLTVENSIGRYAEGAAFVVLAAKWLDSRELAIWTCGVIDLT